MDFDVFSKRKEIDVGGHSSKWVNCAQNGVFQRQLTKGSVDSSCLRGALVIYKKIGSKKIP